MRIEGGWQDGRIVKRDYFVAEDEKRRVLLGVQGAVAGVARARPRLKNCVLLRPKTKAFTAISESGPWLPRQVLTVGDSTTELRAAEKLGDAVHRYRRAGESNPLPPDFTVFANLEALNRVVAADRRNAGRNRDLS
ncbi:hypothetical protein [Burkholderia stagnalis]|uniref:hypothetical protein n=1 Tax=Burkholderia stagnalis TaxID=1503054 RepID=UPI000A3FEA19|nr:hypothetical protein [Burkholderia stagnalis]